MQVLRLRRFAMRIAFAQDDKACGWERIFVREPVVWPPPSRSNGASEKDGAPAWQPRWRNAGPSTAVVRCANGLRSG